MEMMAALAVMAALAASKMAVIPLSVQGVAAGGKGGCRLGWQVRRYCRLVERRSKFDIRRTWRFWRW
jgi:hypothetical protein